MQILSDCTENKYILKLYCTKNTLNSLFRREYLIVYEYFFCFSGLRSEAADCSISEHTNRQIEFYLFVRRREPFFHFYSQVSPDTRARVTRKGKRISHLPALARENGLDRLNL